MIWREGDAFCCRLALLPCAPSCPSGYLWQLPVRVVVVCTTHEIRQVYEDQPSESRLQACCCMLPDSSAAPAWSAPEVQQCQGAHACKVLHGMWCVKKLL